MSSTPLIVVGLDGGDFRYLDRFEESLPNIGRLRQNGVEAELRSTHPPWTGSAWPSMYTGLDPSSHSVYDFFNYRGHYPDEANIVTRNDVRSPAVWNYLSHQQRRSVVLNMPVTHPPEELRGILMPGYLAPASSDGFPAGIRERLSEHTDGYYGIYAEHETSNQTDKKIDSYVDLIRRRGEAASGLLSAEPWDFALVQVQKTDAVFHNSSNPADFERVYRAADSLVGALMDACDGSPNVVLCSDHGIGPVTGYTVYVNEILRAHELVSTTTKRDDTTLRTVKGPEEEPSDIKTNSLVSRAADAAIEMGLSPLRIKRIAERLGVAGKARRLLPQSVRRSLSQGVDWSESLAYCRRPSEQGVRINVEGRDGSGVVSQAEYDEVREKVISILSGLKTPEGDDVFDYVRKREEIYDGPYTEDACDVLFLPSEMNHVVSADLYGETMSPIDSFNHKRDGLFVAAGPHIDPAGCIERRSLLDVAPTLLALLEEPVPNRMQGAVPEEVLTVDVETNSYGDVSFGTTDAYGQDQTEVRDRLADLGYL